MRKLPSLKALQAFDAAARLGSFTAAAEELSVTPSAVSHQIRALETELGIQLFERVNRAIILTDTGKRFGERIARGFNELEAACSSINRATRLDVLTIHCVPTLAKQWLMPRLQNFQEAYPEVDVRLNASPDPVNLLSVEADFDIRFGHYPSQPGVRRIPFPPETMLVLCAPSLAMGENAIRAPIDLSKQRLIHSEVNLFNWHHWFEAEGLLDLYQEKGPRFDRSFLSISAAVDGNGVCLESHFHVQQELARKQLIAPFGLAGYTVQGHSINFVQSRNRLPKIQAFKDWILKEIGIDESNG
ncbi:LysR substrate-binding domain-containing protein [Cohaesibacter celericrescens]|uniref:LysR substrate-binding domain-containing protein n=1 Tax=Cohaesibacter celericrescens TaxID=2067669 RepID=UPI0035688762